jgi:hypothetical protein
MLFLSDGGVSGVLLLCCKKSDAFCPDRFKQARISALFQNKMTRYANQQEVSLDLPAGFLSSRRKLFHRGI